MNTPKIRSIDDIYQFVSHLQSVCDKEGETKLFAQLDDALHMGSSGLEILGAIRQSLIVNSSTVKRVLGSDRMKEVTQVMDFIDKAYGR